MPSPPLKRKDQISDRADTSDSDSSTLENKFGSKASYPNAVAGAGAALCSIGSDNNTASWGAAVKHSHKSCSTPLVPASTATRTFRRHRFHHLPSALPTFSDPRASMWTSTHDANAPSEDRYCSLVNVLLRPPPSKISKAEKIGRGGIGGSSCSGSDDDLIQMDDSTQVDPRPHPYDEDNSSLIRLSFWSVIDGHGGGCVATYASEVLLPHIAASVSRALKCTIIDRGNFCVNGQHRDANAIDLEGLIRGSDRSKRGGCSIDAANPNSVHYKSPGEADYSEADCDATNGATLEDGGERNGSSVILDLQPQLPLQSSPKPSFPLSESISSTKTPKTAVNHLVDHAPVGTHSAAEVAEITRATTHSFLSVDEGWINSIDPITTHQSSCTSNGKWNAGACALVVFTVQRLDWTRLSTNDPETEFDENGGNGGEDTSHNKDAARRRKLDFATKTKSMSSLSTLSSASSLATVGRPTGVSIQESGIIGTEDDEIPNNVGPRIEESCQRVGKDPYPAGVEVIRTPGACKCHFYRPHDAMLYTAHVGDCRAVMLGSAPPRTIKVHPTSSREATDARNDTSDDYSSCDTSSGDSEGIINSDRECDSADELGEADEVDRASTSEIDSGLYMPCIRHPGKRQRHRRNTSHNTTSPFGELPSLSLSGISSSEGSEAESDDSTITAVEPGPGPKRKEERNNIIFQKVARPAQPEETLLNQSLLSPLLPLSTMMRPIDLTTDHSAYNPAEVTAVLRRCKNAPRAISAASGGGIKRVAGSLAVTRALGDAYLKTPLLSFFPYKRHAPYITARPEVNCRLLSKGGDRILILATDGVWERCSGDDVLRWVRHYYTERTMYHRRGIEKERKVIVDDSSFAHSGSLPSHETSAKCTDVETSSDAKSMNQSMGSSNLTPIGDIKATNSDSTALSVPNIEPNDSAHERIRELILTRRGEEKHASGHKRVRGTAITSSRPCPSSSFYGNEQAGPWPSSLAPNDQILSASTVSDAIVRRVLNKVRRARNMKTLRALTHLPRGRARRSKHDDITASVIDMSGFVN